MFDSISSACLRFLQQKKDPKGDYKFSCQHGHPECKENKIQACAIDQLQANSSVLNKFIICYMSKDEKGPAIHEVSESKKINADLSCNEGRNSSFFFSAANTIMWISKR